MRSTVVAITTLLAGFLLANMLGVAVAEAPAPTAPRTISVEGVASVPIGQADNAASATAVYRQGMAGAVADGQSKAEFLAGKVSATLGAVQSLGEGGGEISCTASEIRRRTTGLRLGLAERCHLCRRAQGRPCREATIEVQVASRGQKGIGRKLHADGSRVRRLRNQLSHRRQGRHATPKMCGAAGR
jgi:predicted RecA/RadA family phage recombinase